MRTRSGPIRLWSLALLSLGLLGCASPMEAILPGEGPAQPDPEVGPGILWEFPADWTFESLDYRFVSGSQQVSGQIVPEGPRVPSFGFG